ncbi:AlpA family phage regulatory protein [Burkholderia cepacia]|uniref:AlpA family phage regulatory protein n=1 Tax=Burkholderia cepacia TaxID=292 RepID=UPI003EE1B51E
MQVRVKLPAGPLIELTSFCKAIAEALRPTAARHFEGIECIVAKMQKFRRPMVQPDDSDERLAAGQSQTALQVKGRDEPSQPIQERREAEERRASEVSHASGSQQQGVGLSEAPYLLTEDERRVLSRMLPSLPPLRYPITDDDKAAFLNAWSGLSDRPVWEPILMSAADLERYKMEQREIQIRHQWALRDEFARGRLTAVDAAYTPVVTLAPGSFILRDSAVAYLSRCGLALDDDEVGVGIERHDQSPEPTHAPATMPLEAPTLVVKEFVAPTKDASRGRVADVNQNDPDSKGDRADAVELLQPTIGVEKRKVGKVARLPRVIELTGLRRSSIYNRMDSRSPYYDSTFPRCFSLSTSESGAVGWDEEEIKAWVTARASRAGT